MTWVSQTVRGKTLSSMTCASYSVGGTAAFGGMLATGYRLANLLGHEVDGPQVFLQRIRDLHSSVRC